MRTLYYVPMLHGYKDLGDLGQIIKTLHEKISGKNASEHDERAIEALWETTRSWVLQTVGDARGLVIYEDGMPVGPREKIYTMFHLALKDHPESPLFRLTKELIDKGAILEGTEDINLVVRRVAVYKDIYKAAEKCQSTADVEKFIVQKVEEQDDLIRQADCFIAERIDRTLPEGGRGILFIGHRHAVDKEIIRRQAQGLSSMPIIMHKMELIITKRELAS